METPYYHQKILLKHYIYILPISHLISKDHNYACLLINYRKLINVINCRLKIVQDPKTTRNIPVNYCHRYKKITPGEGILSMTPVI